MRRLRQQLLNFFLPWTCAGCGTALGSLEDQGFCGRCWLAIPRIQGFICRKCGIPLKDGGQSCYACRQTIPLITVRAATEYRGSIPRSVYRFKYKGRKTMVRAFGVLLLQAWERYPELHQIQGVIPVPLYPKNERVRGYNQAELLAVQLAQDIGKPILPLLIRTRKTSSQIELNRSERRVNVRKAFDLHPLDGSKKELLQNRSFLMVDDVCTTTSTLAECARVLRRAGVGSVKALVLARDL